MYEKETGKSEGTLENSKNSRNVLDIYRSLGPRTTASGQNCLFASLLYVAQLWLFQYWGISKF